MSVDVDDDPVTRTHVPSDDEMRDLTGISKNNEQNYENDATQSLRSAEAATGSNQSNAANDITGPEKAFNFNPSGGVPSTRRGVLAGLVTNRKAMIGTGGGLTAIFLSAAVVILLGPLQFMQFAELLKGFHMATPERQSSSYVSRLYMYALSGGDLSKTRLGAIGYQYNKQIEADLAKKGITVNKSNDGTFRGAKYDPKATYTGKKGDYNQLREHIANEQARMKNAGLNIEAKNGVIEIKPGSVKYNAATIEVLAKQSLRPGQGKVVNALRMRTLKVRFGLKALWNPITRLDAEVNAKRNALIRDVAERMSKRVNPNRTASPTVTTQAEQPKEGTTPAAGDISPDQAVSEGTRTAEEIKAGKTTVAEATNLEPSRTGGVGGIAAKAAGVLGLLCMAQGIEKAGGELRRAQLDTQGVALAATMLALPDKMRDGGGEIASSGGTGSTDRVDIEALGAYKHLVDDFMLARSVRNEVGESTEGTTTLSPALSSTTETTDLGKLFNDPTYKSTIGKVCEVALSPIGMIAQIGFGLALAPIATVVQGGLFYAAMPAITSLLKNGNTVPDLMTEAEKLGKGEAAEFINVKARQAVNISELNAGGGYVSATQAAALKAKTNQYLAEQRQSESIAKRYFDPANYNSLAGRMLIDMPTNNTAIAITKTPRYILSSFGSILSGKTNAADMIDDSTAYYGTLVAGLPDEILEAAGNPFENSNKARKILTSSGGGKYIDMLKKCNGLETVATGDNLDFKTIDTSQKVPDYETLQKDRDCQIKSTDLTEENIVRAAVYALVTMKANACYAFDDSQSCEDIDPTTSTIGNMPGFKIMTFNANSYIFDDRNSKDKDMEAFHPWEERKPAIQSIISTNSPDIFGMQEAFDDKMYSDIKAMFPTYAITGSSSPERRNPILYKPDLFNLVKKGSEGIGIGEEQSKAFTWAVLAHKTGAGKVIVINAHLDSDSPTNASEQTDDILKEIDRVNVDNDPVIVLGDFNTKIDEPSTKTSPVNKFISEGYTNTRDEATTKINADNKSYNGYNLPLVDTCKNYCQIDYVLVKDPQSSINVNGFSVILDAPGGIVASDHNPILASMVFSGIGTSGSATGVVNSQGYSWPIDIYKDLVSGNQESPGTTWTCNTGYTCHYEGSLNAIDLADYRTKANKGDEYTVGKAVFAITSGELNQVKVRYAPTGCYSLHVVGDDGHDYFYGHLRNPIIQPGQSKKIKAGEKVAEVGERKCTGNNTYPHLHIDRAPKGEINYGTDSRDPTFEDLIVTLHNELTK